jgi:chromosome segregation ATPase
MSEADADLMEVVERLARVESEVHALRADVETKLRVHGRVLEGLDGRLDHQERESMATSKTLHALERSNSHLADQMTHLALSMERMVRHADSEESAMPRMLGKLDAILDSVARHAAQEDASLDESDADVIPRPSPGSATR